MMFRRKKKKPAPPPPAIVDYSAQRQKMIEWLGDRYLLAQPLNRPTRSTRG